MAILSLSSIMEMKVNSKGTFSAVIFVNIHLSAHWWRRHLFISTESKMQGPFISLILDENETNVWPNTLFGPSCHENV